MKKISNWRDFFTKLENFEKEDDEIKLNLHSHNTFRGFSEGDNSYLEISNQAIYDKDLDYLSFEFLHFKNCRFQNLSLSNVNFESCLFESCSFIDTSFINVGFYECDIIKSSVTASNWANVNFSDNVINDFKFINCPELLELYFGGCNINKLKLHTSVISHTRFEPIRNGADETNFEFISSEVNRCFFQNIDFSSSYFRDCSFVQTTFTNCNFKSKCFDGENKSINGSYCAVDLQTIQKSEDFSKDVLAHVFGITSPEIKEYIIGLTSKVIFQSVFISYSFSDKIIAKKIYDRLKSHGVFAFLFEKDAPGGKKLKRIMTDGVQSHDRLLFIASKNSIRSEACQFELTQGRKRQEKEWETIFFPIHIDNYLFELKKEDIKPKSKQKEFWENIEEIKEINSIDFSPFIEQDYDETIFDQQISSLIKQLRK